MNRATEQELTETFTAARDALTPETSIGILRKCNDFTAAIKRDPMFRKLEENYPFFQSMIDMQTAAFERCHKPAPSEKMEPNAARWVHLLGGIVPFHDFDAVALQFALFIIAQERGLFLIEDDKSRLFTCYLHVRIACDTLLRTTTTTTELYEHLPD